MRRSLPALHRACALAVLVLLASACTGVGGPKPGAPAHHREHGFANPNVNFTRAPAWFRLRFFVTRMFQATFTPRTATFPVVATDVRALRANAEPLVTWVGHATLLVQLDGVNILTDPQWSRRASPVSFAGPKRFTPPAMAFEDLPPIHVVVISHDHYDHLDVDTVRRLDAAHRPHFLVPLGIKAWFAEIGITERVDELDWWDARTVRGLTFTCVPAQHFAQRTLWDMNRRLWAGWSIAGRDRRLFFAGDTGYFEGFKEIGARLGPFDLAAIPIGAYLPSLMMRPVHTDPREALDVFTDVRAKAMVPIHWGTFDLADEPLDEPPRLLEEQARARGLGPDRVWILKHGETRRW